MPSPASAPSASTSAIRRAPSQHCGEGPMLAANGVYYFSWSGRGNMTNILDPVDPALALTGTFFGEPNDGLVGVCSSHPSAR